ncbi:hypothetical protein BPAE_1338g00010 [Botrytis paeoniae]|uniref:DUF4219 domain-containing protein n=1 Tax=Botrytis paeoniae TaxID=278948 RepID=A0A4Z1EBF4_9HELO|nr:hypothetical protein BPAE_1338g00010 [Botrytis paeoniae]
MEEDYGFEKLKISKLTGMNYRSWSIQVKQLLKDQGLWNVVEKGTDIGKKALGLRDPEVIDVKAKVRDESLSYNAMVAKFMEFERRMGPRESIKENALSAKTQSKGFKGKCFNYEKGGHRKADCRKPKKDSNSSNTDSPSTRPLSTPSGGRGLLPRAEQAKTVEISWMANIS